MAQVTPNSPGRWLFESPGHRQIIYWVDSVDYDLPNGQLVFEVVNAETCEDKPLPTTDVGDLDGQWIRRLGDLLARN